MAEFNWSENIEYRSVELRRPSSTEELQTLVAGASKVKALGTRHSFNRVADTDGLHVCLDQLDLDVSVDLEAMTATIPGSWSYSEVGKALDDAGVALKNMGSLPHISLAGATATGTHGSGSSNQILAAEISSIEMVTAEGSLTTIDNAMPEFNAVAVGLGAFGVITTMTLDVVPAYQMRQDIYRVTSWDAFLKNLEEVMASAYSVQVHADFSSPDIRAIWQKSLVQTSDDGESVLTEVPATRWGAERLDIDEIDPGRITRLIPGPWHERLPHFTPESSPSLGGDELQTEYFVDRSDAVDALNALREMGERIDAHLHGSEIRTVAADEIWLSPTTGRDCLTIGLTWKKHPAEVQALLPDIEAALAPFAPTAHWGKLFAFGRDELEAQYERLDDFVSLAKQMDPAGKFSNRFLQRLLT